MNAGKKQIPDIFNQKRVLEIPFFQRSYVWRMEHWERFLDDMSYISSEPNNPYFFGSLILKQKDTPTARGVTEVRVVIDGQQRLTTLILFYKALSLLKNTPVIFDMFKLRALPGSSEMPVALSHNRNDVKSFEKIARLEKLDDLPADDSPTDNILNAYNFFRKNIKLNKIDEDCIEKNAIFVVIDLENEDEQQIFDTLNSLGVRLTTAELLKNYFFSRDNEELYESNWRSIFEQDEDTREYWSRKISTSRGERTFIDWFFYAYLQIKIQETHSKVSLADREKFSRLEKLFESYKLFIDNHDINKEDILHEIKDYASIFRAHIDDTFVSTSLPTTPGIERINVAMFGLETTTLIPYILFAVKHVEDEKQRNELFGRVEAFVLRRLAVRASNRGYAQFFSRMIGEQVRSAADFNQFIEKVADTGNAMPSDKELHDGFHTARLVNKSARGILYFIESRIRSNKAAKELRGFDGYSLEHLMPKKWQNRWGEVESSEKEHERNQKLLTMGNLAIITPQLNASIRDSEWQVKVNGKDSYDGLKLYAAGLETLKNCLDTPDWNESEIEKRADELFGLAKDIWPAE